MGICGGAKAKTRWNSPAKTPRSPKLFIPLSMDAFGSAHRAHASTVGVPSILKAEGKPVAEGYLMIKEVDNLTRCVEVKKEDRPYIAILGGLKVSDKIKVIDTLLKKCDKILIGGAMFEDMPLNFGYFAKANRIVSLPKALYRYRKAKSPSLTTSNRSDRAQQHLDSFALIRIFADRSGDPRLVTIVRHSAWRIKLSLLYDIHLSKKAGLSKPEVKRIRRDLALLGKKSPLPVEAKAWSYLLLDSPH